MPLGLSRRSTCCLLVACCLAGGCKPDPPVIDIEVVTGHESDTFSQTPAVERVAVVALDEGGAELTRAETTPGGSFSLGEVPVATFASFAVEGRDAEGTLRVGGRSLGVLVGFVASDAFPVFAQRSGAFARPPKELDATHVGGVAAVVGERFVLASGGEALDAEGLLQSSARATFYDLLSLGPAVGGTFGLTPRSIVVSPDGEAALLVGDDAATWIDFGGGATQSVALPAGLDGWDQVAGGLVIDGDEASYVVGAARTAGDTDRVLVVHPDHSVEAVILGAPRRQAAAAWLPGVGLVVAAGSDVAPGVEVLASGASAFVARDYAPIATRGAALTALSQADMLLAGGVDGADAAAPATLALDCASDCALATVTLDTDLEPLVDARAFTLASGEVLLVGQHAQSGETRVSIIDLAADEVREVVLREPRRGAAVTPAPNGTLVLVGGVHLDGTPALTLESYLP